MTTSTTYDLPGTSLGSSGRSGATSPAVPRSSPGLSPKMSMRSFLSLPSGAVPRRKFACTSIDFWNSAACDRYRGSSLSSANSPVLAPGNRWFFWSRRPVAGSRVPAKLTAGSVTGASGMWQEAQFGLACGG